MISVIFMVFLGLLAFVTLFIMPWVNHFRIKQLQAEIDILKMAPSLSRKQNMAAKTPAAEVQSPWITQDDTPISEKTTQSVKQKPQKEENTGFEQQFAARMPVWIGGIALALAGFFMVKYSIENDLISPAVRVIIGAILGCGLLSSAKWVRNRPNFANGVRISQSLAGAGIAVLYVVSFASARLYDLVPMSVGFLAMAAVTATALVLSLRHGPPIALLGMAGGFLTPALLSTGGGSAFTLFVYLYFTASGLLIVARKAKLWWLSLPTIALSFLWVLFWLFSSYTPADSLYLGLFLVAIAATIVITSRQNDTKESASTPSFSLTSILNYIGLGGALGMMGLIAAKSGFGFMEFGLFGLLAVGGVGLAYFNSALYGFIPLLSMAVNIAMLFAWGTADHVFFCQIMIVFAAIFIGSGYVFMFKSRKPLLWAGLAGGSSIAYYLLAYYKLHNTALFASIPLFWGIIALVLAYAAIYALFKIYQNLQSYPHREYLYAIFSVAASAFISLALFIELDKEFLSVAFAAEMLVISWLNTKTSIKALKPIIAIIACIFALLLLPQIILLLQLTLHSLIDVQLRLHQSSVPIVNWPLFQLGVPALLFFGSSYLLRKQADDRIVRVFEVVALSLIAVMGYYVTRNIMHPHANVLFVKVGFFERGIITNVLFLFGLACLFGGRKFERATIAYYGIVLCAAAAFRILYFDMITHNPLWHAQQISGTILFNSLMLPYGLPIAWCYFARRELNILNKEKYATYAGAFILVLIFAFISMNVRHIFHGSSLHLGATTNAEIYSYSAAWLVLGIALLFGGILKQDKMLRYASLSVILFTVGKVFLYDASALDGLYRVFSFFGLGLCLIGLSYFYTRFVFNIGAAKE